MRRTRREEHGAEGGKDLAPIKACDRDQVEARREDVDGKKAKDRLTATALQGGNEGDGGEQIEKRSHHANQNLTAVGEQVAPRRHQKAELPRPKKGKRLTHQHHGSQVAAFMQDDRRKKKKRISRRLMPEHKGGKPYRDEERTQRAARGKKASPWKARHTRARCVRTHAV